MERRLTELDWTVSAKVVQSTDYQLEKKDLACLLILINRSEKKIAAYHFNFRVFITQFPG